MGKLTELIWYELGDGLNATDVTEAAESIKRLMLELWQDCVKKYPESYRDAVDEFELELEKL